MRNWREQKRRMRRGVHEHMGVPALYIHAPGATPFPLTIRGPHTKRPLSVGELNGSEEGWAEREDAQPRLIFWRAELPEHFRQGAIISVEPGEAYRLALFLKPDDVILAVEVVPLDEVEAVGLPVPSDGFTPPAPAGQHPGVYRPGYIHTQAVPAAVWTVVHGLGYRPAVAVTLADGSTVEAQVTHIDDKTVTITFDIPEIGEARCV